MTKYSLQTKLNAVHDFLNGYESYKTVADKHNVDMTLLKEWVRFWVQINCFGCLFYSTMPVLIILVFILMRT